MVPSKFTLLAFIALFILLSGGEAREAVWSGSKVNSLCCSEQQQFGRCDTKEADERCEQMCLAGCSLNKGGGCQAVPSGSACSCYCA
ncbi:unnamed protein product [Thlaspi arvense]|uniref:Defensin-like protein n=1 Tax=Thlaspi arvense TaxID=13288 RepID=A0AAU9SY56_THLAR|nr:unnamed protein product [Thlaspi arvense]